MKVRKYVSVWASVVLFSVACADNNDTELEDNLKNSPVEEQMSSLDANNKTLSLPDEVTKTTDSSTTNDSIQRKDQEVTRSANTSRASTTKNSSEIERKASTNTENQSATASSDTLGLLVREEWTRGGTQLVYGETAYVAANNTNDATVGVTVTEVLQAPEEHKKALFERHPDYSEDFYREYDLHYVKGTVQNLSNSDLSKSRVINISAMGDSEFSPTARTPECLGMGQERPGFTAGVTQTFCHAYMVKSPTGPHKIRSKIKDVNGPHLYWGKSSTPDPRYPYQ